MSFEGDVAHTAGLSAAYRQGLKALRKGDRRKVKVPPRSTRRLAGSADIDLALAARFPQAARWDYAVAISVAGQSEFLHWIEVHSAGGLATIGQVLAKPAWLRNWLSNEGSLLNKYKREFVWIASGRSAFQQNSPQLKKMALQGLRFAGGHCMVAG